MSSLIFGRLKDSIRITFRVLSIPVLYYFFDNLDFSTFFLNTGNKKIVLIIQFVLLAAAKVILISGGLGSLAKISVGAEELLSNKYFMACVTRYWAFILLCSGVPAIIHFVIYLVAGHNVSFDSIATLSNVPLLMGFAIILDSVEGQDRLLQRKSPGPAALTMITAFFLSANVLAYLSRNYLQHYFIAASLLNFGIKLLELMAFVFFIKSIYSINRDPIEEARPQLILVNPPFSGTVQALSSLAIWFYPPVFIVLKALTPKKYRIREYNQILWNDHYYQGGALVAITCLTANSPEAYKMAKEFRKRGCSVVMGGPHVSIFPLEALEFCNSVVTGPVESVWNDLLLDYERGGLKRIYSSVPREEDMSQVRSYLADQSPSTIAGFLETRRGCKFNCYFCANSALRKGFEDHSTSIDQMMDYLRKVAQWHKVVNFIDTNIYSDPEYMKKLLEAMIPLKFKWVASASIDIATDDQTVQLLKESGCAGLLIGFEIFPGSNEAQKGGKLAMAMKYFDLTRKLKQAGIKVKGHFIYGFSNDNFVSLCRLWFFCFRLWPQLTVLSFLTPIPGSAFFEEMVKENKLRDINWRSYTLHTLVYDNPGLDNAIFRRAFPLILLFFMFTTSTIGVILAFLCGVLIYMAFHLGA